ncbi:MAG: glycoside hydrolase family 31 protein [Daejeonella sp.]
MSGKVFLTLLTSLFMISASAQTSKLSKQLGNFKSFQKTNTGVLIYADQGKVQLSVYDQDVIRVRVTSSEFAADTSFAVIQKPQGEFSVEDQANELIVNTQTLSVHINKKPVFVSFYNKNGQLISGDDPNLAVTWQGGQVSNYRKLFPKERFIGLGEKTGNLDRRGSSYTHWNTDAPAYGLNQDPLYKTIPFYIGLHDGLNYGIFFDNTHKSFFNFGGSTDDTMSFFGAEGGEMNYYFFGSATVAGLIRDFTSLTGRMEMPPLWSLGYQQCRWSYHPDTQVLEIAETFRKKQIPADAIYLDIHYMDAYKIFTWHPTEFPDPKGMIDKLKNMGFHVVTIVDPGIKVEKGYKQYDEGVQNKYFANYPGGTFYTGSVWPGRCNFPDFFRPEVRKWWGKSFTSLTQPGVEGFWNDMNEPAVWEQNIPDIIEFGEKNNRFTLKEARNAYGLQMSRATFEGTRDLLGRRPFVLTRAAYAGIQRYSAVWTGDNVSSDAHMLLGQRLVNSIGLSGVANIGVDVGGFIGEPSAELMVRWTSLGVYTPMFRNHAEINAPFREPWRFGEVSEKIMKKDIEQRYRLLPYLYSAFYQATQTGLPVSRSLTIDYTTDENIFNTAFQNQFLFGDNILVAPVESTKLNTEVYLPKGDWYRLSSGEKFSGNKIIKAAAPLNDLPVFVKAGGIIPMQSVIQNTSEKGDGILHIHVWYGKDGSTFTYYEDDGSSYQNQKGVYYKRQFSFDPSKKQITLAPVEGSFTSRFTKINMVLHGFKGQLKTFKVNGKAVKIYPNADNETDYSNFINSNQQVIISY